MVPEPTQTTRPPITNQHLPGRDKLDRRLSRLLPPLLYLGIALAFSWPLPLGFTTTVYGSSGDVWPHLWWVWWVGQALAEGHNPYRTSLLFHPFGAPLYLMGMDLVTAVLAVPLQPSFGLVTTFNVLMIAASAFGAYAAYLLALGVTGSRPGALVAGALFGFAPLQSSFGNMGQLELVSVGFLPLTVLCLLRLGRRSKPIWAPEIALGAGSFALAALTSWYQAMMLGLCAVYVVLVVAVGRANGRDWAGLWTWLVRTAAVGAIVVVVLAPVLLPTIREARSAGIGVTPREWIAPSSLNVADVVAMNRLNPLSTDRSGVAVTLGFAASLLALVGLWRGPRERLLWAGMGVLFFLLALGPFLLVGSRRYDYDWLPYNLLYGLPLGSIARAPLRFMLLVTLAQSVLAAWGVRAVWKLVAGRWPRRDRALPAVVTALLLALVLAEWLPVPRNVAAATVPGVYQELAAEPPGALLELPYDAIAKEMYWQTTHGRPITGGYISRKIPYPLFDSVPVIKQLRDRADNDLRELVMPDIVAQPPVLGRAIDILNAYGLRYVIVHKDELRPWEATDLLAATSKALPDNLIIRDDANVRVYLIPRRAASGVVVGFGRGWYPAEQRAGTAEWFRWTQGAATLSLTQLDSANRESLLRAFVFAYARPVTLDLFADGKLIQTVNVPVGGITIETPVTLRHGFNGIELRAREPALRPTEVSGVRDNRSLSFGVSAVSVVSR